ncbi:MAG: acyltransferase family protein [Planctomycetota bacterium]|jgi:predicted acyltransferase
MDPNQPQRLMSIDAYRGFVMLAMASGGLALSQVARNPEVFTRFDGTQWEAAWRFTWESLGYQASHVAWTGCSFWDLIQPSFMFMVGVSLPLSMARRRASGERPIRSFAHAVWRALVLILLGVLLSTRMSSHSVFNFTFVNVLTQIGLGYLFLYLLRNCGLKSLFCWATVILVGYGAWFAFEPTEDGQAFSVVKRVSGAESLEIEPVDETELPLTREYLAENLRPQDAETTQFQGWAAAWNKHTNAAAEFDRWLLNVFPRVEELWRGRGFWANRGGYQTLNFVPSLATMIFGLMAGRVLSSERDDSARVRWLAGAGILCLVAALGADTTLWPTQWLPTDLQQTLWEYSWSACPAVKRIWTPTWAVFAAGWTFCMLAFFYWLVEMRGCRRLVFPFAVVGLNSIAMYCIAQLFKGWIGNAVKFSLGTLDTMVGTDIGQWLRPDVFAYAPILDASIKLFVMWYVCYWMYRKGVYIRI